MAAQPKVKATPDEFCDDGKTRKLNKSRPFGVVYADGFEECKFVQDNIPYRGDGTPVGYVPAAQRGLTPVEPTKEEVVAENETLRRQIAALMARVEKLEQSPATPPPPAAREAPDAARRGAAKA